MPNGDIGKRFAGIDIHCSNEVLIVVSAHDEVADVGDTHQVMLIDVEVWLSVLLQHRDDYVETVAQGRQFRFDIVYVEGQEPLDGDWRLRDELQFVGIDAV